MIFGPDARARRGIARGRAPGLDGHDRVLAAQPGRDGREGDTLDVVMTLTGGTIVDATSTTLTPDTGHVHLSLDGKLVSMTYGLVQEIPLAGLAPGRHTLEAEFVAADHGPFDPRGDGDGRLHDRRERRRERRAPDHAAPRPGDLRRPRRRAPPRGPTPGLLVRSGGRRDRARRRPPTSTMTFTESPDPTLSVVHVLNTSGADVEAGPASASAGPKQLVRPAPRRPPGRHLHRLLARRSRPGRPRHRGDLRFGVGSAPHGARRRRDRLRRDDARALAAERGRQVPVSTPGLVARRRAPSRRRSGRSAATCPSRRRLLPIAGAATLAGALAMVVAETSAVGVSYGDAPPLPRGEAA